MSDPPIFAFQPPPQVISFIVPTYKNRSVTRFRKRTKFIREEKRAQNFEKILFVTNLQAIKLRVDTEDTGKSKKHDINCNRDENIFYLCGSCSHSLQCLVCTETTSILQFHQFIHLSSIFLQNRCGEAQWILTWAFQLKVIRGVFFPACRLAPPLLKHYQLISRRSSFVI